jgi:hypothetical protein
MSTVYESWKVVVFRSALWCYGGGAHVSAATDRTAEENAARGASSARFRTKFPIALFLHKSYAVRASRCHNTDALEPSGSIIGCVMIVLAFTLVLTHRIKISDNFTLH